MGYHKKFLQLYEQIENFTENTDTYARLTGVKSEEAEKDLELLEKTKLRSIGDKESRNYIIKLYTKLLISNNIFSFDESKVKEYINFDNLLLNETVVLFEILLKVFDISKIIDKYSLRIEISDYDIRNIVKKEEDIIKKHFGKLQDKVEMVATIIYTIDDGQNILDSLQYHNINEIGALRKDYIYIVYKGEKYYLSFLRFDNDNVLFNIQNKNTKNTKPGYDIQHPIIVSSKDNSNRITVAGYGATPTPQHLPYNERIFNLKKITLEEMRDNLKTINQLIYQLICIHQCGKGKHLITGSDMGVGKSTFLNAMIEKIPDYWGIGILDSQYELQSDIKYPWKNIMPIMENMFLSITDCMEYMFKMARDIINVGEVIKPDHMTMLMIAGLRLNSGIGGTMHSISPFEVVTNCRNLMLRSDMYNNEETAEADIARCIDFIFHLKKHPKQKGRIVLDSIVEVMYEEKDIYIEPNLTGNQKDKILNILNMTQIALKKYLYKKNYRYNEIIRYDSDKDDWIPMNLPSKTYFKKISEFVSNEEIDNFKNDFIKYKGKGI